MANDAEQFVEYPGSLLSCERAVIRRDLRVGLILGADGGPYPFPSGSGVKVYTAYGPLGLTPLVKNATNLVAELAFDGISFPILAVGETAELSALTTVEWQTDPAALVETQVQSMLHEDGTDITNGIRLMWVTFQNSRSDNGLAGKFGSTNMSLMGSIVGDGLPHTARLYVVPNSGALTYQVNPSASPNIALRALVWS